MSRSAEEKLPQLFDVLRGYIERGEQIPGLEQLAHDIKLSSKSGVSPLLAALDKMGRIQAEKTPTGKIRPRTIKISNVELPRLVPVRGRIAAGKPLLSTGDDIEEYVPLPARHVRGSDVYLLKVDGNSMTGDGIRDGDYVIVAGEQEPGEGDIAVVFIAGEEAATIKRVRRVEGGISLVSSNPGFPEQFYDESDRPVIQGTVIGAVRWPT